jgi:transposase
LPKHAKHILRDFQVPMTSAMMEGINNKIGRLQRTVYG